MRPRLDEETVSAVTKAADVLGISNQAAVKALIRLGSACVEKSPSAVEKWLCTPEPTRDQGSNQAPDVRSQPGSGVVAKEPTRDQSGGRKSPEIREPIGTVNESSAFQQQQDAAECKRLGDRFLSAVRAGHGRCCLDEWEQANCPSIARRAVRAGRLKSGQLAKLEEALDKANACELGKRAAATRNVPSAEAQRAKALADLAHHEQVMAERAEDGLPVTDEMHARLEVLRAIAGSAGRESE